MVMKDGTASSRSMTTHPRKTTGPAISSASLTCTSIARGLRDVRHGAARVDGYPDTADIVCELMMFWRHECRATSCGSAALAAAEALEPELVLLDVDRPDPNGYDLLRELRTRFSECMPYFVAVSSWGVQCHVLAMGFDRCLLKPVRLEQFLELLELASSRSGNSMPRESHRGAVKAEAKESAGASAQACRCGLFEGSGRQRARTSHPHERIADSRWPRERTRAVPVCAVPACSTACD